MNKQKPIWIPIVCAFAVFTLTALACMLSVYASKQADKYMAAIADESLGISRRSIWQRGEAHGRAVLGCAVSKQGGAYIIGARRTAWEYKAIVSVNGDAPPVVRSLGGRGGVYVQRLKTLFDETHTGTHSASSAVDYELKPFVEAVMASIDKLEAGQTENTHGNK